MVLPKRAGKAEVTQTTSKSLAAAMPASANRRGLVIGAAVGVLVLLLGGVWLATRPPDPPLEVKDPVIPAKVADVVDAGPAVAVVNPPVPEAKVDAGEELTPLPNPPVVAKKADAGVKKAAPTCSPDDRWKKMVAIEMRKLREKAVTLSGKRYVEWEADEKQMLVRVNSAKTPADCGVASAELDRLVAKY